MSGFEREEVLGRNCRFLQGPETEPQRVASIQACIRKGVDCHVRITNYKKDGSTFVNLLSLRPIVDATGSLRFVIGLQSEVAPPEEVSMCVLHSTDSTELSAEQGGDFSDGPRAHYG